MLYTIRIGCMQAQISSLGAQLMHLTGKTEYLWQADPAYWTDRAPTIFPYVARLTNGIYRYEGQTYHLPIHGFAPTAEFTAAQKTDDSVALQNGKLPLCHELFDQDVIVLKGTTGTVTLASERGSRGVRLIAPDFPNFGCWHMPKTDAPYVCLEPWSSLPSRSGVIEDLKIQPDLICLPAGEVYRTQWSLTCF